MVAPFAYHWISMIQKDNIFDKCCPPPKLHQVGKCKEKYFLTIYVNNTLTLVAFDLSLKSILRLLIANNSMNCLTVRREVSNSYLVLCDY